MNAQRVLDALRDGGPAARDRAGRARPGSRGRPSTLSPTTSCGSAGSRRARRRRRGRGRPARSARVPRRRGLRRRASTSARSRSAPRSRTSRGEIVAERVREFDGADRLPVIRRTARGDARRTPGSRASSCWPSCVGCTGPMDPRTGRVLFSSIFPDGFDLAGAMAAHARPADRGRERLQPRGDRRALARRRAGLDDIVGVLAGERIGAGIMVGGQVLRGHGGAAGELAFLGAIEPEPARSGSRSSCASCPASAPEAVFAAAGAGRRERAGDRRPRRALGGQRDRDGGADRQPRGRGDQRRRRARRRGAAGAAARASGGDGADAAAAGGVAAGRARPADRRDPAARSTTSSRGCSTRSTKPLRAAPRTRG